MNTPTPEPSKRAELLVVDQAWHAASSAGLLLCEQLGQLLLIQLLKNRGSDISNGLGFCIDRELLREQPWRIGCSGAVGKWQRRTGVAGHNKAVGAV